MRLYSIYPQLNPNSYYEEGTSANNYLENNYALNNAIYFSEKIIKENLIKYFKIA